MGRWHFDDAPRRLSYSPLRPIYRTLQDLNDLYYFVAVVDHGGFAAAGRALGLQKSRLRRRILQVEERLGVRLLNRSSRRFSVTEIGREFYDRCVAMLVEAEAAEQVRVFPSRRGLLPSVRALLDFLARECAARRQLVSGAAS